MTESVSHQVDLYRTAISTTHNVYPVPMYASACLLSVRYHSRIMRISFQMSFALLHAKYSHSKHSALRRARQKTPSLKRLHISSMCTPTVASRSMARCGVLSSEWCCLNWPGRKAQAATGTPVRGQLCRDDRLHADWGFAMG